MTARRAVGLLLVAAVVWLAGCEDSEDTIVVGVGVALPVLTDPGLASQSVLDDDRDERYQAVEWLVTKAELLIDGAPFDLLFDEPCVFYDTVLIEPRSEGACSAGVIVGPSEGTQQNTLLLTVERMTIRRAAPRPADLGPSGEFLRASDDWDADGVPNGSDNCPLLPNPDQADVCTLLDPFTGTFQPDSDGDGVADLFDNCVWYRNRGQEDTMGLTAELGAPDGIGDACDEQTQEVSFAGGTRIELLLGPVTTVQPAATTTFQIVDFDNGDTLPDCDFPGGSCPLLKSEVRFCPSDIPLQVLFGCS